MLSIFDDGCCVAGLYALAPHRIYSFRVSFVRLIVLNIVCASLRFSPQAKTHLPLFRSLFFCVCVFVNFHPYPKANKKDEERKTATEHFQFSWLFFVFVGDDSVSERLDNVLCSRPVLHRPSVRRRMLLMSSKVTHLILSKVGGELYNLHNFIAFRESPEEF